MGDTLQFVDSISTSPTVRLDLNNENPWALKYDGTDFSPPDLHRSLSQTLLADGALVTAAAYDNRVIRLRLELIAASPDAAAAQIQALNRELNRPPIDSSGVNNILKWQPGTSAPQFFRTMRSPINKVTEVPGTGGFKLVDVDILADSHLVGLKETIGGQLLSVTTFESGIGPWTGQNGTVVQSSTVAHAGTQSLRLTPAGGVSPVAARSEDVPVTAGLAYQATSWMQSVAGYANGFTVAIDWLASAGGSLISTSGGTVTALPAGTWAQGTVAAVAPAGATSAHIRVRLGGTPLATDVTYVDDTSFRQYLTVSNNPASAVNGCFFDLADIKGDVETPLFMQLGTDFMGAAGDRYPVIGLRRRGTPSLAPFLLQAESMTTGVATALAASNDTAMSGTGPNYMRTTPTDTIMDQRVYADPFPSSPGVDVRGRYRVHLRLRQSVLGDLWNVRLTYGPLGTLQVDLPAVTVTQAFGPRYVDLGTIQYPYGNDPVTDGYSGSETPSQGIRVAVFAQRVSGTGTLDFDCLLFVPADDVYSTVQMPPDSGGTGVIDAARTMVYSVGGSGEIRALPYVPKVASGFPLISPGKTNRIVFLADGGSTGDAALTTTATITPYYWPKYLYARPPSS